MKKLVIEADDFKYVESNHCSPGSGTGGRPVRKRGYYRALKRCEFWAVFDNEMDKFIKITNANFFIYGFKDTKVVGLSEILSDKLEGDGK